MSLDRALEIRHAHLFSFPLSQQLLPEVELGATAQDVDEKVYEYPVFVLPTCEQ